MALFLCTASRGRFFSVWRSNASCCRNSRRNVDGRKSRSWKFTELHSTSAIFSENYHHPTTVNCLSVSYSVTQIIALHTRMASRDFTWSSISCRREIAPFTRCFCVIKYLAKSFRVIRSDTLSRACRLIISEMIVENSDFSYLLHSALPLWGQHRNIPFHTFGNGELEWCSYPTVKKFDDTLSRFDRILACDGQIDTQTYSIVRTIHSIAQ